MALVIRETLVEVASTHERFKGFKIDFPRTQAQRDRGKVIGICCGFVKEHFVSKFGSSNVVVEMRYSPNRVAVKFGQNETSVIKLSRDFTSAKVTMESATALGIGHEELQTQLNDWLE